MLSALNVSRSLYDDINTSTSVETSFGFAMLSLALANVDLDRGKHIGIIARSMLASVKKVDVKFRALCRAITKTAHIVTSQPIPFKSKALEPMLAALASIMDQDISTLHFDDPEFLASLNCREAFFETARLLMVEDGILEPDGKIDSSNFHWAVMLSSSWAQELLLAYCPAYLDVLSDWKDLALIMESCQVPRHFVIAMQAFCAHMAVDALEYYGVELSGKIPLHFVQFPLYLSLGNLEGATRTAIKLLEVLKGWDLVFEIMPTIKVVYPLFILCCFFLDHADLNRGMEAYQIISSFTGRYQAAQRALQRLEEKLALLYPAVLASTSSSRLSRKRGLAFLEEIESTPDNLQPVDSSPESFLASLSPSTSTAPEATPDFVAEEVKVEPEGREDVYLTAWSSESNELSSPGPLDDGFWSLLKKEPKEDERGGVAPDFELDFIS